MQWNFKPLECKSEPFWVFFILLSVWRAFGDELFSYLRWAFRSYRLIWFLFFLLFILLPPSLSFPILFSPSPFVLSPCLSFHNIVYLSLALFLSIFSQVLSFYLSLYLPLFFPRFFSLSHDLSFPILLICVSPFSLFLSLSLPSFCFISFYLLSFFFPFF